MIEELWIDNVKLMKNAPTISTSFRTVKQNDVRQGSCLSCWSKTAQNLWGLLDGYYTGHLEAFGTLH